MHQISLAMIMLLLTILSMCFQNNKLPNGLYLMRYTMGAGQECKIKIMDTSFVQYFENEREISGKIIWEGDCEFSLDSNSTRHEDSIVGPLKMIYDSFGEPVIKLLKVNQDTICFQTTHLRKEYIWNEGYFLRLK